MREARSAGLVFVGPLKVALMLRLAIEYGLGVRSDGEGRLGVVDIVIVTVSGVSVLGGERSARHASSGDGGRLTGSTCL